MMCDRPLIRRLSAGGGVEARLIYYPPGLVQAAHEHARAQVSFLLLGVLVETVGPRTVDAHGGAAGIKPQGVRHAASFGPGGALMLSLEIDDPQLSQAVQAAAPAHWRQSPPSVQALLKQGVNTSVAGQARDLFWDAAALAGDDADQGAAKREPWLVRVHEAIWAAPQAACMARLAVEAGVHRAHLSRAYRRAYGAAPSQHRLAAMAARGLAGTATGRAPLAKVAAEAGFADQSHMTRSLRRLAGASPSWLRAALGA